MNWTVGRTVVRPAGRPLVCRAGMSAEPVCPLSHVQFIPSSPISLGPTRNLGWRGKIPNGTPRNNSTVQLQRSPTYLIHRFWAEGIHC